MHIVVFSAVTFLIICSVISFNRFVRGRQLVKEAWSGIDVQLRRRYDLIPQLIEMVKGYRLHERQLFEEVAEARSRCMAAANVGEKKAAENVLSRDIKNIVAVAESYPELKANENYLNLQHALVEVEDQIQLARRYYNGTVRDYNIRIESFPSILIAKLFGFAREEFFEIELATERNVPGVKA